MQRFLCNGGSLLSLEHVLDFPACLAQLNLIRHAGIEVEEVVPHGTVGSNPTASAKKEKENTDGVLFLFWVMVGENPYERISFSLREMRVFNPQDILANVSTPPLPIYFANFQKIFQKCVRK